MRKGQLILMRIRRTFYLEVKRKFINSYVSIFVCLPQQLPIQKLTSNVGTHSKNVHQF